MKEEIKECILKLYPSGKFEEKNVSVLFGEDYLKNIYSLLEKIAERGNVNYVPKAYLPRDSSFTFLVTLKQDPDYKEWNSFSDEEKLKWLKESNRKYPVVWLIFSRIYPLYDFYYDYWIISRNTGELFIEGDYETSDRRWDPFLENIGETLKEYNIQRLLEEELQEEVEFVKEEYFEDEYDPVPQHRNTNVYQCLFQ
jgi:hypothetical protein